MGNKGYLRVPLDKIDVKERQRREYTTENPLSPQSMESLKFSMEHRGLLYPLVVEQIAGSDRFLLIAGGRRFLIAKELKWTHIEVCFRDQLSEIDRLELEYEENLIRKDFTWWEEDLILRKLHKMKKEKFDRERTFPGIWTQRKTSEEVGMSEAKLSQSISLADALDAHPELKEIPTRKEALKALRRLDITGNIIASDSILIGKVKQVFTTQDFATKMPELERESIDLIITDLTGFLNIQYIAEIHRVLKYPAHCFLFFPLEEHPKLVSLLEEVKFQFKKKPYIWHIKGEDSYYTYLWCSRNMAAPPNGLRELLSTGRDKFTIHTLEKSQAFLASVVSITTGKGDVVLDPICYGTTLALTCIELGRNCMTYCPSRTIQEQAILNLEQREKKDESSRHEGLATPKQNDV